MEDSNFFFKQIGRLQFYFQKSGSEVKTKRVCLDKSCNIENIREIPYEKEIEEARKEAYRYFGLKIPSGRNRK